MMATDRKSESPTALQDEWVSLPHACRLLGMNRSTVLTRVVKGDIVAQHIAGRTVVSRASIEQMLAIQAAQ